MACLAVPSAAQANPKGGTVMQGSATIVRDSDLQTTIKQHSDKTIIDWRSFSIGNGEHTRFVQPSAGAAALNRVTGGQVSKILGKLTANGQVFLVNPNGIVFGKNAQVDVGALFASTHDISNQDFLHGDLRFTLSGAPDARIENHGLISVKEGGLVALVAPSIENSGVIYARLGQVALAAGNAVTIDPYGDDLIVFEADSKVVETLTDPDNNPLAALIDISGAIAADGGRILVTADMARDVVDQAINMSGYVQARTAEVQNGEIVLKGGEGDVQVAGTLDASGRGDAIGGEIRVTANGRVVLAPGGAILAQGGEAGGDGGFVAVAGAEGTALEGRLSVAKQTAAAENGWLYTGSNVDAAEGMRNPNKEGAGSPGSNSIYFEANRGQSAEEVDFLARNDGGNLYLSAAEAVLALRAQNPDGEITQEVLRTALKGAKETPEAVGEDKKTGVVNYYLGDDESKWIEGVETFGKVRYKDVYDGVDLVYYGNKAGDLEYDLVVQPGADPGLIGLDYAGAESITITERGDLAIDLGGQQVIQKAPLVYQTTEDARVLVPGDYVLTTGGTVTIALDVYDSSKALVIDPVIDYSSYLGGSGAEVTTAVTAGIAADSSGNIYIAASTVSADFPTASAAQGALAGPEDATVTKIDSSGALVYSTYLGGSGGDFGHGIAVDSSGNAVVVGRTSSADFPTAAAAQGTSGGGAADGFVTQLSPAGAVNFSTYWGGAQDDDAHKVAIDSSDIIYVVGNTQSNTDFPLAAATQGVFGGATDAFLATFTPAGANIASTYLGGTNVDSADSVAVDASQNVVVAGFTDSPDFPTMSAFDGMLDGAQDAFVTKYDAGGAVVYSTYLGGSGTESAGYVALDQNSNAYVVTRTDSADYPILNAYQPSLAGGVNLGITKLSPTGTLLYSTYLGGSGTDVPSGIAASADGEVFIVGVTTSVDYPTLSPLQGSKSGANDFLLSALDASGNLSFSSYLGSTLIETSYDGSFAGGKFYTVGTTNAGTFPQVNTTQAYAGGLDLVVTSIDVSDLSLSSPAASTGTSSELLTAIAQYAAQIGNPIGTSQSGGAPDVEAFLAANGLSEAFLAEGGAGQEILVQIAGNILQQTSLLDVVIFMNGDGAFSLEDQQAFFGSLGSQGIIGGLLASADPKAQEIGATLQQVAAGDWESADGLETKLLDLELSETATDSYLLMLSEVQKQAQSDILQVALQELAADPSVASLPPELFDDPLAEPLLDGASLELGGNGQAVLETTLPFADEVEQVLLDGEPVAFGEDGQLLIELSLEQTTIGESYSLTIILQDGTVIEQVIVPELQLDPPIVTAADTVVAADGSAVAEIQLAEPEQVAQVLVDGEPVEVAEDGSVSIALSDATSVDSVTITIVFADGSQEEQQIAVGGATAFEDFDAAVAEDGSLQGEGQVAAPDTVEAVLVEGEEVEVAEDGSFEFALSESTESTSVTVTIVYADGSRADREMALDSGPLLAELETVTTADGETLREGKLADAEGVEAVLVDGQWVEVAEDGSFTLVVTDDSAIDDEVSVTVIYQDGSRREQQQTIVSEPLLTAADALKTEEGESVVEAQLAETEDVAEVLVDGEPVEVAEDGSFSFALSDSDGESVTSVTVTVIFADGSQKEQEVATGLDVAFESFEAETGTDGDTTVEAQVADPETVEAILVEGEEVEVAADGSFEITLSDTSAEQSISVTILYEDGSRSDREMALDDGPVVSELDSVTTAEGETLLTGELAETEGVETVIVDGEEATVAEDGSFSVTLEASDSESSDELSITVIYEDGSRREQQDDFVESAVLAAADSVLTEDGETVVEAQLAETEDVAEVLVDGAAVEVAEDGSFSFALDEAASEDSITITIVFADGSRKEQEVAVSLEPALELFEAVATAEGETAVEGQVAAPETVDTLLVEGEEVAVAEDGSFELTLSETAAEESVSITIIFEDGSRSDLEMALDSGPIVAALETVTTADGETLQVGQLADAEDVATLLIDGQAVEVAEDGSFTLALSQSSTETVQTLSITVIYEDGSRREQEQVVLDEPLVSAVETLLSEAGTALAEMQLATTEEVAQVLADGEAVELAEDGSFSIALGETSVNSSISITIVFADGTQKQEQVAVGREIAFEQFAAVTDDEGGTSAAGKVADAEEVRSVLVDGQLVALAEDGSFQIALSETAVETSLTVTIIYADGSRLDRQMALNPGPAVTALETVTMAEGVTLRQGQLAATEGVAALMIDGQLVTLAEDGSFSIALAETAATISQTVSITIIYADGSRSERRQSFVAPSLVAAIDTLVAAGGGRVAELVLAALDDVAQVLVNGESVEVLSRGRVSVALSDQASESSLSVALVYADGTRREQTIAIDRPTAFDSFALTAAEDGAATGEGRVAEPDAVQAVVINGEVVTLAADGSFRFDLSSDAAGTAAADTVAVTVVYADGSRVDRRLVLASEPALAELETVTTAEGVTLREGRLAQPEEAVTLLIDGQPVEVAPDGSFSYALSETRSTLNETGQAGADGAFRFSLAEAQPEIGDPVAVTVVYADGSRREQRTAAATEPLSGAFDSFTTLDGQAFTEGRLAPEEQASVAALEIGGRRIEIAADGSFRIALPPGGAEAGQAVPVTVLRQDGSRAVRQLPTASNAIVQQFAATSDATGAPLFVGQLANPAAIAQLLIAGQPVALGSDGRFQVPAPSGTARGKGLELQIAYRDPARASKRIVLEGTRPTTTLRSFTAADGRRAVEGQLAKAASIAAAEVDGQALPLGRDGSFVYRQSYQRSATPSQATLRVTYKDGTQALQRLTLPSSERASSMRVLRASQTADGYLLAQGQLSNFANVHEMRVDGRPAPMDGTGRFTFWSKKPEAGQAPQAAANVVYKNGTSTSRSFTLAASPNREISLPPRPRKVALLIGVGDYGGALPDVGTALADSSLVGKALQERYGYEPRMLANPGKGAIVGALQSLQSELGPNDHLVVYYAGASQLDDANKTGYWLPHDASATTAKNWLSQEDVSRLLGRIPTEQTLLLSDGEFVSPSVRPIAPRARQVIVEGQTPPARQRVAVLTSGASGPRRAAGDEAHSLFARNLVAALSEGGERGTGNNMLRTIQSRMTTQGPAKSRYREIVTTPAGRRGDS